MIPDPRPKHVAPAERSRGVDLSSHQSIAVTQELARAAAVSFAFVKVSEGLSYVNPLAHAQATSMHTHGHTIGLYHFLADDDGARQWDHFEQAADFLLRSAVPVLVACDYEPGELRVDAHGDAVCRAFIARGKQRGFHVGLYGSANVARRNFGQAWTWAAWWAKTPPPFRWDFWQFTDGKGLTPPVDWNVFRGDRHALAAFAAKYGHRKAGPPPLRWWLTDTTRKHSLGPYRSAAVLAARLVAYALSHPRSSAYSIARR